MINAGDGTHAHPTQALLDAMTLRQHLSAQDGRPTTGRDLAGMRVAIVGDILHSRVARSNIWLLNTLGAEVVLVAPPTLLPSTVDRWPVTVSYDFDRALAGGLDAVMLLRIQRERMHAAFFPSSEEYARLWGLSPERLEALDRSGAATAVLHPGPMNRGLEISSAAADSSRSMVLQQVANGVSVRMAVLYHLLSGPAPTDQPGGAESA